jgi:hypothetical protein
MDHFRRVSRLVSPNLKASIRSRSFLPRCECTAGVHCVCHDTPTRSPPTWQTRQVRYQSLLPYRSLCTAPQHICTRPENHGGRVRWLYCQKRAEEVRWKISLRTRLLQRWLRLQQGSLHRQQYRTPRPPSEHRASSRYPRTEMNSARFDQNCAECVLRHRSL